MANNNHWILTTAKSVKKFLFHKLPYMSIVKIMSRKPPPVTQESFYSFWKDRIVYVSAIVTLATVEVECYGF